MALQITTREQENKAVVFVFVLFNLNLVSVLTTPNHKIMLHYK